MQSSLEELRHTLKMAEDYLNQGGRNVGYVRFHLQALREDMNLVSWLASSCSSMSLELHQKSLEIMLKGRRTKRRLEQILMDLESISGSAAPPRTESGGEKSRGLKIRIFDGDATKYLAYRNIFMQGIVNNPYMTASAKWLYFENSLCGPPAALFSEYPHTIEALEAAFRMLDSVYGNTERITAELYRKLENLPPASTATESIRLTHAKLEGILLSLAGLYVPVNGSPYIRAAYIAKFPASVINREVVNFRSLDLQTIRDGVARLLGTRESLRK